MSSVGAGLRLLRAGWIMVREGVVAALPGDQLAGLPKFGWRVARLFTKRKAIRRGRSERLAGAVTRLGPSYVKLGQFLATRPDVVGTDIALDLALLQDRMETFPKAEAVAAIEGSLGRPIGELYETFGEPVAAASIAQVHPATVTRNGEIVKVAVKVIRPGVRRLFLRDLESYFLAARLQEHYIPAARRLRPVQITEALPKMAKAAQAKELKAAFEKHLRETQSQVKRLEQVFQLIDETPKGKKCPAIDGILKEGDEIGKDYKGSPALDAGLLAAAQAVEHYEISRYGTLRTWAQELGLDEAVRLLDATLDEEKTTDANLSKLAESSVNRYAEAA